MKRVLFVDQSGALGGAELSLLDLVQRTRHQASVAVFAEGPFVEQLRQGGARVHVLLGPRVRVDKAAGLLTWFTAVPAYLRLLLRLTALARRHDVLYANTQKAFVMACAAAILTGRPLVWHLRDILSLEHFSGSLIRLVVGLANLKASRVIANSQATADAFVQSGGRPALVTVVYNGFDAEQFEPRPGVDSKAVLAPLGLAGQRVVGVFSRLSRWKGQHLAIEAIRPLRGVHLVLVGAALFGEDDYERELRQLSDAPEVQGRVHFAGFQQKPYDWIRAMDVTLHTSIAPEPFGRVIVESMLCGVPVIAAAAGGALELVQDRQTGRLFEPGSVDSLGEALTEVLGDAAAAVSLADRAQVWARSRFALQSTVSKVDEIVGGLQ